MLDVDVFRLDFIDWTRTFLKESHVVVYDILDKDNFTSFKNIISCLTSFLENPAKLFLVLKSSFSMKDSKTTPN